MARNFFTGGLMPSDRLAFCFADDLTVEEHWRVLGHALRPDGRSVAREPRRAARPRRAPFFEAQGGSAGARVEAWRVFFMACAELFAFHGGNEWMVSHYLLKRRKPG